MKKLCISFLIPILCLVLSALPLVRASEDSWTTLAEMPTARSGFGVAVVDGKIYAIGGYNGSILATNEMYDPEMDVWITKTSMLTARIDFAIAVYQNKIYVIGGFIGGSSPSHSGYTGLNEVYNPLTDTWETKEPMPTARAYLDANVVGDNLYLIGGAKYDVIPPGFSQDAGGVNEVYTPSNDSWSTKTPNPMMYSDFPSVVLDNKVYLLGSRFATNIPTKIYTPETDTWISGEAKPTPVLHADAGATTGVMAPKRIYVIGGEVDANVITNLTQVYDPETDVWTIGTPMPTPRRSLGVAVINDELYAIGGYNGNIRVAVNEKYTPADYIPEFPSWIILPLILVVSLAVVIVRNRLRRKLAS